MRIPKKIAALLIAAVIVVAIGSLFAYRTAKWALGRMHPSYASGVTTPPAAEHGQLVKASSSQSSTLAQVPSPRVRGEAMAQAFRSGKLPLPLPIPPGNLDQAAAELAKRVIATDAQSTAALLTAIQMSGFSVRGEDGSIQIESVKPGQGIRFDAWEAAATAKLFGDGMHIKLADLGKAFSSTLPPLKNAPVATLLIDGVHRAALSNQPARRFWARFITELGRQSEHPYDLLAQDLDPAGAEFDAIQVSLILRRFAADVLIQDRSAKAKAQLRPLWEKGTDSETPLLKPASCRDAESRPLLTDAVWHGERAPRLIRVQEGENSNLPCTLAELAAQILDSSAYLSGFGFDKLLEYLKEHGVEGAGKYGTATSVINSLLAIIKLLAYFACLDTNITMSGEPPLIRTQSPYSPGERRTLTATVKENIGNWQALNCVRIALNGAGIDFDLPNDGPVAGAEIQWVLIGSGVLVNQSGANAYLAQQILEFVSQQGSSTIQSSVGVAAQNFTAPKTDEHGQATIDIEGSKQKPPLQGTPVPVMKQSEVRFTVEPKPMSMSQDLIDAIGAGNLGGPVGKAVNFPIEVLLRSNIYFSKSLIIPVKDWQECDGGWGGTISYTGKISSAGSWGGGDVFNTAEHEYIEQADVQLRGDPNNTGSWSGSSRGTFSATQQARSFARSNVAGCIGIANEGFTASGSGNAECQISDQGNNTYQFAGCAGEGDLQGQGGAHYTHSGSCPPGSKDKPDETNPVKGPATFPASFTAVADPNKPGVLHGSITTDRPIRTDIGSGTQTVQISWDLTLCK